MMTCDYLIVGAGLFGSVLAERIANDLKAQVIVIDRRSHVAGNCYSQKDPDTGIEFHKFGTHIFHTSSSKAWEYIRRFTDFNNYHHQVLTTYRDKVYQLPITLETINAFYNLNLKPYEAEEFLRQEIKKAAIRNPRNLEEKAISLVGRPLYEAFIRGYTTKQWGMSPRDLPTKIITRLPVRFNYSEVYFKDARWQGIPLEGYTKIFERMLDSPNIRVELNCDYFNHRDEFAVRGKTIYTGPIDRFFDYRYGRLNYRSVRFQKRVLPVGDFQGTAVMNYADVEVPYTRVHEPRHLHAERSYPHDKTVIFYETALSGGEDPYYPVNTDRDRTVYQQYRQLADQERDVIIGGRLGDYAYYDMDKTILAALKCYEQKVSVCVPSSSREVSV